MARREEYEKPVVCECGNKGAATYEENSNPVYHGDHDKLVGVSGDFSRAGDKVVCNKCQREQS